MCDNAATLFYPCGCPNDYSLTRLIPPVTVERMPTNRLKIMQSLYLESDRTKLLDQLATEARLPKAILLREAVDDLLVKYKM